ncbi:MAG: CapA family protein [Bacteroidota bacterium]
MKINFVGDLSMVAIDTSVFTVEKGVQKALKQADLNVANLECPLTNSTSTSKYETWYMKAEPKKNYILDLFDVFSLANNHVLDFSREGLKDTIEFLDEDKKLWFGAGLNEIQANKPLLMEKDGYKLAFLGLTRWHNAKGEEYGTATDNLRVLKKQIKELKKDNYFVILMPHWNYVHIDYPCPSERARGHKLINAGADLIVGAHPHNLQGFEVYKGKHIFHSLGNFIFHTNSQFHKYAEEDIRNRKTFILEIDLHKDYSYKVDYTYVYDDNSGVRLMTDQEKLETIKVYTELSRVFESNSEFKKRFYENAHIIVNKTMNALKKANDLSDSKVKVFLDRIFRIRKQDVLIKLHSMKKNNYGKTSNNNRRTR